MKCTGIYTLIICGLFYFSEGKPCPEKTRPHKTRCEIYFKCRELTSKMHVWVPEKCEQGLVYEPDLMICVLPGDDWECTLGDALTETEHKTLTQQDTAIETAKQELSTDKGSKNGSKDTEIDIINESDEDQTDSQYDGSGDDESLLELDGFLQAENKETEVDLPEKEAQQEQIEPPKTSSDTSDANIDPKLTGHLQRLAQLIDGLKGTYQTKEEDQQELRPHQLNAFLAHFNIKHKFDTLNPSDNTNFKASHLSTTTPVPSRVEKLQNASKNKTLMQEHLDNKLEPETKVLLSSPLPKLYGNSDYSNSQIVVNRPEGSVLFNLPPYSNEVHFNEHGTEYSHNSPKISEDTLKTVLELSKQMIATQSMPKVVPNPAYYPQPILPLFIAPSGFPPHSQGSPFSSYYNGNNNLNNNGGNEDSVYIKPTPSYNKPTAQIHGYKKPSRPGSIYRKPSTTIIHNNVIPLHLTSTNSGEKEVIDSYGQSLGLYPPLGVDDNGNNNNGYQSQTINHMHHHSHRYENNKYITSVTTMRPMVSTMPTNQYENHSPYPSDMSVTTARPFDYQPTQSTLTEYYTPSPHLNENNVNQLFHTPERYPTVQYNNIPRPIDASRPSNSYQQIEQPSPYNSNSLFPSQIEHNKVKIRPNSEKFESIEEMDADDVLVGGNGGSAYLDRPPHYQHQQQQQQQQQLLTYNFNNENTGVNSQLAHLSHVEPTSLLGLSGGHNHPYMPRPQVSAYSNDFNLITNKPKYPSFGTQHHHQSGYADGTQLVNVGGNFINYDVFQSSILPLLSQSQTLNDIGNIEVITCAAGVRQANASDCTRYYVCSKKDGKVLSYSCPPYTAFNGQTRICDAHTYAVCSPEAIVNSYTVSENKRLQLEAIKALQEAKRRREQAMKAQSIANLLNQYSASGTGGVQLHPYAHSIEEQLSGGDSGEKELLSSYMQQAASMANVISTTGRPLKKRKYYCKEGDKIADQTSIYSYFVCYKNAQGMMKGHKLSCSKGLIFCPKTTMCTLASKCS